MFRLSEIDLMKYSGKFKLIFFQQFFKCTFTSINVLVIDIHFLKLPPLPLHLNPNVNIIYKPHFWV